MISVNTKRIKDMGTLRYVKTPAELQEAAENNLEFFDATMQAVKVFYKTTLSCKGCCKHALVLHFIFF